MNTTTISSCEVSWYREGIIEYVYQGDVTLEDLEAMAERAEHMMRERAPKIQFVDTLQVTKVPRELGEVLSRILATYRELGGSLVVMVANSNLNQMLGRSMSFGSGVELEVFQTRNDALEFLSAYITS